MVHQFSPVKQLPTLVKLHCQLKANGQSPILFTTLPRGQLYTFVVTCKNGVGESGNSTVSNTIRVLDVPVNSCHYLC